MENSKRYSLSKKVFRQTVRLSRKVQDGIFFLSGLPQKCNFCGKRRNNGTDGIFATKRKFGSGIRDGVRRTMVLREVKKMTNRCKNGENSIFSPFLCYCYLLNMVACFLSFETAPMFLCLYRQSERSYPNGNSFLHL